VGIADDVGDAGERREFFGRALCVAAGDHDLGGGIVGMKFADGVAGLGIGGCGDSAGVDDDNVSGLRGAGKEAATVEELAFDGGAVGLGGAAAELLDVEGGHGDSLPLAVRGWQFFGAEVKGGCHKWPTPMARPL